MTDLARLSSEEITSRYIDAILQGDTMDTQELEIKEDAPGARQAPGLGLGDIIKYGDLLAKIIAILAAGEGEFDFKYHGIRKHVQITNIP